jgi:hypothetical protein
LELRHAIPLAPRWALQGVVCSDFGTFQSFTEDGRRHAWRGAVKDDGDQYWVHFSEGSHAQTVTLTKEEGAVLLDALNDLGDII